MYTREEMKNKQKTSKRKLSTTKIKNNVTEEEENSTKSIFKEESVIFFDLAFSFIKDTTF